MRVSIEKLTLDAAKLPAGIDRELHPYIAAVCRVEPGEVTGYKILKRSIDARFQPDVKLVYSLVAELKDYARPDRSLQIVPEEIPPEPPSFSGVTPPLHPVIVGAGPAGLFCALILAIAGAKPVVLERGRDVVRRKADIDRFFRTRELDEESNLLFGEGGAGTWSDGKLHTRIRDPRIRFVLQEMIEAGAPENIAYYSHPHIGSDLLPGVIERLRRKIESLGGIFRWDARAGSLLVQSGACRGVALADGERLEAPLVVSACGHSARDLILASIRAGAAFRMKGFQLGCRIEHPQDFINWMQFGVQETIPSLGSAEYNLVSRPVPDGRTSGATTFCMCPGGEIIPATPKRERLCTNGMSESARSGRFANAAIVSTLPPETFGTPEEAYEFLDALEKRAYDAGGGEYVCPAQKASDFLRGNTGKLPKRSSWKFGLREARVDELLPDPVRRAVRRALIHFDRQAEGYVRYGTLLGVETRVSSPIRFERDETTRENPLAGFYPVGEGAGLAGGITSSAVDGILTAEAILRRKR
ncbi:MAG: FAD-dependent monooxygenase [Lentisphaeria bacterium]|nr:FAD-dependent monooxygenase [Lentisphaeria bacterium]